MSKSRWIGRAAGVLSVLGLFCLLAACPPGVKGPPSREDIEDLLAGSGPPPKSSPIFLTYVGPDVPCVLADPDPATIWKSSNKKPKKARWWVDQDTTVRWYEIHRKGGGDDLQPVASIECDDDFTTGKLKSNRPAGVLQWEYKVVVYSCKDGEKDQFLCESDPMLRIKD